MTTHAHDNAFLDARETRRLRAQGRAISKAEKQEIAAERMIGQLIRDGRTIHFVWPCNGKYREGDKYELTAFLIRNRYV